jgi:hypothetical protein
MQLAHLVGFVIVDVCGPVGIHGVRDRFQYKLDAIWGVVAVEVCKLLVKAITVNESVFLARARNQKMDLEVQYKFCL